MFCSPGFRAALALLLGTSLLVPQVCSASPWLPFGPDGGDARSFTADPSDHTHLYLGTANGWVYESHDSGGSWQRLSRVAKRDDLVLDNILVDQRNPRHLMVGAFALSHPDGGFFVSFDGGKTWTAQAEMRGQSIRALAAAPTDPKTLVAGTLRGVFRSTDGGARWQQISPPDSTELHEVESIAIDPRDPRVIYAGTWHLPWKTTDGGEHWNSMKEGIIEDSDVFSIIVDPKSPETVYASACSGIYKSENAGELFHKIQGIPSTARRTRVLLQDPTHLEVVFAGTTEGLWRTDDSGKTWNRLTGPEVIVNDVEVDAVDSKKVLIATDRGGVLASEDGGTTFHSSNAGFSARQITAIKRDADHPGRVLAGVVNDKEWGGVFESRNGGINWSQLSTGLGGRDIFSLGQAPDGTMLAGTGHGIYRLDQAAGLWARVEKTPASDGGVTPAKPVRVKAGLHTSAGRGHAIRGVPAKTLRRSSGGKRGRLVAHKPAAPRRSPSIVANAVTANTPAVDTSTIAASVPVIPANASPLPMSAAQSKGFDGGVYGFVTSGTNVLAATSLGLMTSGDNGLSWTLAGQERSESWRFLAAAKSNVVAASLYSISFSSDGGVSWSPVLLPEGLTQVAAVATSPSGEIWVGGREGIYVSADSGHSWNTPKNLFVNSVNSIFYDEVGDRMMVTTNGYSSVVFLVQLPGKTVSFADSGWNLRFARPIGDYLVAATLFDGIVVQPQMVVSPFRVEPGQAPKVVRDTNGGPPSR